MILGIALLIDEEFRGREKCDLCHEALGASDFVILIQTNRIGV